MIVRKEPNGTLTIVAQTDHSRLVGQLAAHWGNAECAAPQPYESVVRAATYHDYGWLRYETGPLIDPDSGEPYQFLEVPLTATQLAAYQWSLDWMADIDSYSGLIVNMHRTGLWQGRYQTIKHPTGYNLKEPSPEIRGVHRQERGVAAARASKAGRSRRVDQLSPDAGVGPARAVLLLPGAVRRPHRAGSGGLSERP